jgi:hypothetical protein
MQPQRTTLPSVERICLRCGATFRAFAAHVRRGRGRYCSRDCLYARHPSMEERFWSKVQKTDTCWLWTAGRFSGGYGQFEASPSKGVARHPILAHRYSYELAFGPIPKDLAVCHRCDVRHCVRPDHLFLGTGTMNMADMRAKGRSLHSERNPSARLTTADVTAIRRRHGDGAITVSALAREFGVARSTIHGVLQRKNWAHVP